MDRDALALLLAQGLSLAEIGRRFNRDESTIGYWVKKHGLRAVNTEKHAARGGLAKEQLEELVEQGLSIRAIADETGYSPSAVRHWIKRHGLATAAAERRAEGRRAKAAGEVTTTLDCQVHGRTEFRLEGRGAYRCLKCRRERVTERRRAVKEILVEEAGGACVLCGYDRCAGALQFHHRNPTTKLFGIAQRVSCGRLRQRGKRLPSATWYAQTVTRRSSTASRRSTRWPIKWWSGRQPREQSAPRPA